MERDGTYSDYNYSKPNRAIDAGVALAMVSALFRAVGERLGILKVQELGKKKPEGNGFWEKAKKSFRHAAIPAIMAYVHGARKVEQETESLDRFAGIEPGEKGKRRMRAAIIGIVIIPIAIIAFNIWDLANRRKPAQEKKLQEKVAPAPRKAVGVKVHGKDVFYQMAFGSTPKNTFVVQVQQPVKKQALPIGFHNKG